MQPTFELSSTSRECSARTGVLRTAHGSIETPCFVPVGTQASLKSLSSEEIRASGTQLLFVNTYHLHLRPGEETIKALGGVHTFMHHDGPLISDSGGFQAFSLGLGLEHGVGKIADIFPDEEKRTINFAKTAKSLVHVDPDGVTFRSHVDGRKLRLTPESSIRIQEALGTDIALALDECTSPLSPKSYVREALLRTTRWAGRSLEAHKSKRQLLFGIIQGGHYRDLREKACRTIGSLPFDGFAVGGDFGRSKREMVRITALVMNSIPRDKPRHILGIGEIDDIFRIVENGADSFDCVMPSRLGRMGHILHKSKIKDQRSTISFTYDITKKVFSKDSKPLDEACLCWVCQTYSRAYMHHLFRTRELLGYRLATYHNVSFLNTLVGDIRRAIRNNSFIKLRNSWLDS
ncbi:tRNA guanosine(34) transglycosylase Tgt [Patescibacteria group bacterium]|nr:tRNA guanosine(34) transglycosylase Tgt [Patescibacteria group bacterium]